MDSGFGLLVFDLDGTLIDSSMDLAAAVNATRAEAGLGPLGMEQVAAYVGNGAPMLVRRALGEAATDQAVERGLRFFLRYYRDNMLVHTRLYPGVREALESWGAAGRSMAVLTNKPVAFSRDLVDGLGLGGTFERVYGGNSFASKKPDPYGLRLIMRELGFDPRQTLMVGDSSVDVLTARNAGVASAGVTFGFRPEDFERHPPDFLVDDLRDLEPRLAARDGSMAPAR